MTEERLEEINDLRVALVSKKNELHDAKSMRDNAVKTIWITAGVKNFALPERLTSVVLSMAVAELEQELKELEEQFEKM